METVDKQRQSKRRLSANLFRIKKSPPMQPIQLSADWRSSISVIGAGVGNGVGGAGVG